MAPSNVLRSVIINREAPPFDKPELRRAMALTLDRKAFIDTLTQGKGTTAGRCCRRRRLWGMPSDRCRLPGYDPDVGPTAPRRALMERAGYGPDNRIHIKIASRISRSTGIPQ